MDLLEHPLEAVAFRLYSLPIPEAASAATAAAAAWTCLAAVLAAAAAAGLWRLRSSTPAAAEAVSVSTKPLELEPSRAAAEVSSPDSPEPPCRPSQRSLPEPQPAAAETSPKERCTAYYHDAGCVRCCDVGSDEDGDEEVEEDEGDAEEHEDGDGDVFVADEADPFGWAEVLRSPLPLSPTAAAAEMGRRRYRRSGPTAALGGSVVQLCDARGGGGLTPTASPRWRCRGAVVGAVVSAF